MELNNKSKSYHKSLILGFTLFASVFVSLSSQSFADSGGNSGGGGDILLLDEGISDLQLIETPSNYRVERLENFITHELKKDLVHWIAGLNENQIKELTQYVSDPFKPVQDLLLNHRDDLIQDIRQSNYELVRSPLFPKCGPLDQRNKEKDAATCGGLRANVYFNTARISRYPLKWSDETPGESSILPTMKAALLEIAFHEHMRHFGFSDNSHELARLAISARFKDYPQTESAHIYAQNACERLRTAQNQYEQWMVSFGNMKKPPRPEHDVIKAVNQALYNHGGFDSPDRIEGDGLLWPMPNSADTDYFLAAYNEVAKARGLPEIPTYPRIFEKFLPQVTHVYNLRIATWKATLDVCSTHGE